MIFAGGVALGFILGVAACVAFARVTQWAAAGEQPRYYGRQGYEKPPAGPSAL